MSTTTDIPQNPPTNDSGDAVFLPAVVEAPKIPLLWNPDEAVQQIQKLTAIAKPAVADIVVEFWIAHEVLVTKKIEGWTWKRFCQETGYHGGTPIRWFERYRLPYSRTAGPKPANAGSAEKPGKPKPQTSPEIKKGIAKISEAIAQGKVSTDDAMVVGEAIASGIEKGQLEMRAGTEVASAVQETRKKQAKPQPKEPDNFYRLMKMQAQVIDGLQAWADGAMKPESRDEAGHAKGVLAGAPNMLIQYARLSVDILGICNTFLPELSKEKMTNESRKTIQLLKQ